MTDNTIRIADYDPDWPLKFQAEKARLLDVIEPYVAAIEHMGSTAVPGLAAKPVIDIMVCVRTLAEADAHCIEPIVALGYEYVPRFEDEMPFRRYFRKDNAAGRRSHQIHLVEIGGEFWERHLLFRDYLRAHPEAAREYEALKSDLAPQFSNVNEYAEAKGVFVRSIEAKARQWKSKPC